MQPLVRSADTGRQTDVLIVHRQRMLADALAAHLGQQAISARTGYLEPEGERRSAPVLVLDAGLPTHVLRRHAEGARGRSRRSSVVLLCSEAGHEALASNLKAHACVSRGSRVETVVTAVMRAREGMPPLPLPRSPMPPDTVARLTDRELEVLRTLADGCTNEDVAARLGVTISTVRTHVGNVLMKLQVRSRFDAVHAARRAGLLSRESASTA